MFRDCAYIGKIFLYIGDSEYYEITAVLLESTILPLC